MPWKLKSTWYRPPSLNTRLWATDIERRRLSYLQWYQSTHGREYVYAAAPPSDCARETLLRQDRIVGSKDGHEILIRNITPAAYSPNGSRIKDAEEVKTITCAPALYVVSHAGKRIDGFLKLAHAKEFAKRYLAA